MMMLMMTEERERGSEREWGRRSKNRRDKRFRFLFECEILFAIDNAISDLKIILKIKLNFLLNSFFLFFFFAYQNCSHSNFVAKSLATKVPNCPKQSVSQFLKVYELGRIMIKFWTRLSGSLCGTA